MRERLAYLYATFALNTLENVQRSCQVNDCVIHCLVTIEDNWLMIDFGYTKNDV